MTYRNHAMNAAKPIVLELASDPRNIGLVEAFVKQIGTQYQLNQDIYGNILISLTEAVNNAIIHGNCGDTNKKVKIRLDKRPTCLAIQVTDEGCGFDLAAVPDPTAPENLLELGGRGVFLMQQLSDTVEFRNEGRTVEMLFRL